MNSSKVFIWRSSYREGFCVIKPPVGVPKVFELDKGISRSQSWPLDVVCKMNANYLNDLELSDNVHGAGFIVVSKRLQDFLLNEEVSNIEFLPLTIHNHKDRVASREYSILNPIEIVDCIEIERSGVKWNQLDKDRIMSCDHLILNEGLIPLTCKILRPKCLLHKVFIRGELVSKLENAGFTGLHFTNASEFKGL